MGAGIAVAMLDAGLPVTMVERDAESLARGRANVEKVYDGLIAKGRMSADAKAAVMARFSRRDLVRRPRPGRPRGRGRVRGHGRQEGGLRRARSRLQARRGAGDQHLLPRHRRDRREHLAPAGRARAALLLAGQHHEAARDRRAGQGERRCRRHRLRSREETAQGAGARRRVRRLHRQPHPRGLSPGGRLHDGRRRLALPDRPGRCATSATRWARSRCRTWPAATSAGPRASARPRRAIRVRATCRSPTASASAAGSARRPERGYYLYPEGARIGTEDPEVLAIVDAERAKAGITPRSFTDDEIMRRYMAAMINEGANVVHERIALRPLDVDVMFLSGYGFPRHRGGPMKYADMVGLPKVLADIREFAKEDPLFWQPSRSAGRAGRARRQLRQPQQAILKETHHARSRHRLDRPHAADQGAPRRVQHHLRADARRLRGARGGRACGHRPRADRGRDPRLRLPRRHDRPQRRAPDRRPRRAADRHRRHHGQPLLRLGPAGDRDRRRPHRRRRRAGDDRRRRREHLADPHPQRHRQGDSGIDPWIVEHKPELYCR